MKKNYLILFFALALGISATAQSYELLSTDLVGVRKGSIDWGDYDNDGDLDLLLCGTINSNNDRVSYIYNNVDGEFELSDVSLPGMEAGSATFGDFDGDEDLDILLTGWTDSDEVIFRNDEGTFVPVENTGIMNMGETTVSEWGDFNNDGLLDVVVAGDYLTLVYKNMGDGTFESLEWNLPGLHNATLRWADYNNDGDLDLIMQGHNGTKPAFYIYDNQDGVFSYHETFLDGLMSGDIQFADYDGDSDMDMVRVGFDNNLVGHTIIYRNDGNGAFKNIGLSLQEAATASAAWGDIDNDGDLDLLVSGRCVGCGVIATNMYRNNGNDSFGFTTQDLVDVERCAVSLVDFDNDGDVDPLITGENSNGYPTANLYRNTNNSNEFSSNERPNTPFELESVVNGNDVELSWVSAGDDLTPEVSLTYNLCIGTSPDQFELITPMAELDNGERYISRMGNTSSFNAWKLIDLPDGTYYWSVQAIDNCFEGSVFSVVEEFTINTVGIDMLSENTSLVYPNPASETISFETPENILTAKIIDINGKLVLETNEIDSEIDIRNLVNGVYFIKVLHKDHQQSISKLIIH
jgi:uncharacterized protein YuzB (UPF0349 family)